MFPKHTCSVTGAEQEWTVTPMAELKGIRIMSRPWQPQDLLDDLQLLIDEEPNSYLNDRRTTLCMARDFLKKHFAEDTANVVEVAHGRWIDHCVRDWRCSECGEPIYDEALDKCPKCGCEKITRLGRITGYLSTTVEHFNKGKQKEFKDRVDHIGQSIFSDC